MTRYTIKAGETLTLDLSVVNGSTEDKSVVTTAVAHLKKAGANGQVPDRTAPSIATFITSVTDAGWAFTLEPEHTAPLPFGIYVMDAKLTMTDGNVLITDPIQVEIKGSVT